MILKLSLDLPEDSAYIPLTRTFGRGILEQLQVIPQDISDVETIVTELASNVVRHANSTKGRYKVMLEYYAERVVIVVKDVGQGFAFRDIGKVGTVRPETEGGGGGERIGGFGMLLVEGMSDKLSFFRTDPHGTTVRAEKKIRYKSAEANDDAKDLSGEGVEVSVKSSG